MQQLFATFFWAENPLKISRISHLHCPAPPAHSPSLRRNSHAAGESTAEISIIMGDKSPKANQKKNSQKQAIANSAELKRKQAEQARTAAIKKR